MSPRKSRLLLLVANRDLGGIMKLALRQHELEWHSERGPAVDAFRRGTFDLAIIDLAFGAPAPALDLIREWRAAGGEFPIVAISDIPQPSLVVESLEAGADDFLRQPFHHDELLARIRKLLARPERANLLRRAGGVVMGRTPFSFGGTIVTPDLVVRFPDGAEDRIRPKHHGILKMFADHAGGLVLKDELVRTVWGSDGNDTGHSVNEYVSVLRRLFLSHQIDFNSLVASEPKAGWRIHPRAAADAPDSGP